MKHNSFTKSKEDNSFTKSKEDNSFTKSKEDNSFTKSKEDNSFTKSKGVFTHFSGGQSLCIHELRYINLQKLNAKAMPPIGNLDDKDCTSHTL
jgi:hypothetical protein